MSDKRQTAVSWAFEQITNIDWKHLSDSDRNDLFDQAKQIEREQMISFAYEQIQHIDAEIGDLIYKKVPEEIYNETYGKND
jgi:hypothetical protein